MGTVLMDEMLGWILKDLFGLFLLSVQVLSFGIGLRYCASLILPFGKQTTISVAAAVGVLLLSFIGAVLGVFGFPSIVGLAGLIVILQLVGLYDLCANFRTYLEKIKSNKQAFGSFLLILGVSTIFWLYVVRDHFVLVSNWDGNVHLTYLIYLLQTGMPILNHVDAALGTYFGSSPLHYYPTGSHHIAACFGYFPWKLGLFSPAQLLKLSQLFVLVWVGPLFWTLSRLLFPGRKEWIYLLLGLLASTFRLYPLVPADHGGYSRLCGYFFVFPLVAASIVYADRSRNNFWWLAALLFVGFIGAFFYHPAAFGLFAFGCGGVFGYQVLRNLREFPALRKLIPAIGLALVGVVGFFWVVSQTGSIDSVDSTNPADFLRKFNVHHVFEVRYYNFFNRLLEDDYEWDQVFYPLLSLRQWLVLFGVFGILFFPKRLQIRATIRFYLCFVPVLTLGLLLTYYSPNPSIFRLGLIYFQYEYRTAESMFFALTILWMVGLLGFANVWDLLWKRLKFKYAAAAKVVVVAMFFGFFVYDSTLTFVAAHDRIVHYANKYSAPLRTSLGELIEFISENTPEGSIFVYESGKLDGLEGLTGRQGILQYGDCPLIKNENCEKRLAFNKKALSQLKQNLAKQNIDEPCMSEFQVFARPLYFITPGRKMNDAKGPNFAICANFGAIAEFGQYTVWGYR